MRSLFEGGLEQSNTFRKLDEIEALLIEGMPQILFFLEDKNCTFDTSKFGHSEILARAIRETVELCKLNKDVSDFLGHGCKNALNNLVYVENLPYFGEERQKEFIDDPHEYIGAFLVIRSAIRRLKYLYSGEVESQKNFSIPMVCAGMSRVASYLKNSGEISKNCEITVEPIIYREVNDKEVDMSFDLAFDELLSLILNFILNATAEDIINKTTGNILKRGKGFANNIHITFSIINGIFYVSIKDNGVGIPENLLVRNPISGQQLVSDIGVSGSGSTGMGMANGQLEPSKKGFYLKYQNGGPASSTPHGCRNGAELLVAIPTRGADVFRVVGHTKALSVSGFDSGASEAHDLYDFYAVSVLRNRIESFPPPTTFISPNIE